MPAERGGIDEHVRGTRQRRHRRIAPADDLAGDVGAGWMAQHKRDVAPLQRDGRRPRGPSAAQDDRVRHRPFDAELLERGPDRGDVRVETAQRAAVVHDRVHRAGAQRLGCDRVEVFHHRLLVRDGDVGAADIRRSQPAHRLRQLLARDVEHLVGPVHA